jgi:hypothetical protein
VQEKQDLLEQHLHEKRLLGRDKRQKDELLAEANKRKGLKSEKLEKRLERTREKENKYHKARRDPNSQFPTLPFLYFISLLKKGVKTLKQLPCDTASRRD